MPKLSFNPDKDKEIKTNCEHCIYSHKIQCGDSVFYECFPVKEYSTTQKAIDNCKIFYNTYKNTKDVYIAVLVYILYPEFEYKITQLGCVFRGVNCAYDELWKELKKSDFYDRVRNELPNLGFRKETLFEPIFVAERNITEPKWKCITKVINNEEINEIMTSLNNKDYD